MIGPKRKSVWSWGWFAGVAVWHRFFGTDAAGGDRGGAGFIIEHGDGNCGGKFFLAVSSFGDRPGHRFRTVYATFLDVTGLFNYFWLATFFLDRFYQG